MDSTIATPQDHTTTFADSPIVMGLGNMSMTNDDNDESSVDKIVMPTPFQLPTGPLALDASITYVAVPYVFDSATHALLGVLNAIKIGKSLRPYTRFGIFTPRKGGRFYIKWMVVDGFLCQGEHAALSLESLLLHLVGQLSNLVPFATSPFKDKLKLEPHKLKEFDQYISTSESFTVKEGGEKLKCDELLNTLAKHHVLKAFVDVGLCARLTRQQVMALHQTAPSGEIIGDTAVDQDNGAGECGDDNKTDDNGRGKIVKDVIVTTPVKPQQQLLWKPLPQEHTSTTRRTRGDNAMSDAIHTTPPQHRATRSGGHPTSSWFGGQPVKQQQHFVRGTLRIPPGILLQQEKSLEKLDTGFKQGYSYFVEASALQDTHGQRLSVPPNTQLVAKILKYSGPEEHVQIELTAYAQSFFVTKLSFAIAVNNTQPAASKVFFWSETDC